MEYIYLIGGLTILLGGAELLVRGAVALANRLHIPPILIGLTIVALGTSAPELVVSLKATFENMPGIAIGNVVGSNIANILLILGLTALIHPIEAERKSFLNDYKVLIITTIVFTSMILTQTLERWHGLVLLTILGFFLARSYQLAKDNQRKRKNGIKKEATKEVEAISKFSNHSWPLLILVIGGGLFALISGGNFVVEGAIMIAKHYHIPDEVIGVTIIAVGTSLPELATSLIAALRKHNDIAIGNIVGSNIWNVLLIIGAAAAISPLPIAPQILYIDIWLMLGATLLLALFMLSQNKLSRWEGGVFFMIYIGYIYVQYAITIGKISF